MKIRMLTHYSHAADAMGTRVVHYNGGQKYDLPETEARLLIYVGVAVEDKEVVVPEVKDGIWTSEEFEGAVIQAAAAPLPHKTSKKRRK